MISIGSKGPCCNVQVRLDNLQFPIPYRRASIDHSTGTDAGFQQSTRPALKAVHIRPGPSISRFNARCTSVVRDHLRSSLSTRAVACQSQTIVLHFLVRRHSLSAHKMNNVRTERLMMIPMTQKPVRPSFALCCPVLVVVVDDLSESANTVSTPDKETVSPFPYPGIVLPVPFTWSETMGVPPQVRAAGLLIRHTNRISRILFSDCSIFRLNKDFITRVPVTLDTTSQLLSPLDLAAAMARDRPTG